MVTFDISEIKVFLLDRGRLLNWRGIEIDANLPKFAIKNFVYANETEAIEKNLTTLLPVLEKIGFALHR